MTFKKGDPKPEGSGRKVGSPHSRNAADLKAILAKQGPELCEELIRIARSGRSEAVRVLAIKEVLDRLLGKSTQQVEGQVLFGVSAELQRLLQQHDGSSRSIPVRSNGVIEHDANELPPRIQSLRSKYNPPREGGPNTPETQ